MQVKITTSIAGIEVGRIVSVSEERGRGWISRGFARAAGPGEKELPESTPEPPAPEPEEAPETPEAESEVPPEPPAPEPEARSRKSRGRGRR